MEVGNSVVITCSLEDLAEICIGKEDAERILKDVGTVKTMLYDDACIEVYFPKASLIDANYWFEPNMLKVL